MSNVTVFVGLDYHQDAVRVCVLDSDGTTLANADLPNEAVAVDEFVRRHGDPAGAVEACCGAAHLADELVTRHGWSIALAHPGLCNRMKQNPDKTDRTDAWLLADLTRVGYLPRVWLAPEAIRELRSLVRHRARIVRDRTRDKLRIRAELRQRRLRPPAGVGRPWTRRWLDWLRCVPLPETARVTVDDLLEQVESANRRVALFEKRLRTLVKDDAVVRALLELDGVGLVTAVTIRAEVGRFDRFRTGKQLAKFCGVTPRNASSGNKQADAGLLKAGHRGLRMVLVELAHRLKRTSPRWSEHARRLRDRGKPANVITAAIANRWTRWLFHRLQPTELAA